MTRRQPFNSRRPIFLEKFAHGLHLTNNVYPRAAVYSKYLLRVSRKIFFGPKVDKIRINSNE